MAAPAYIALQGQTPIELDHALCVVAIGFSRRVTTQTTLKYAAGAIGKAKGVPGVTGSFKVMIPAAGLPFSIATLNAKDDGFTISFPLGNEKKMITHCNFNEDDFSVNPQAGDNELSLSFTGTAEISI